jgi:hypothetical protein
VVELSALDEIVKFNKERNLLVFNKDTELVLLVEELGEFDYACGTQDKNAMVDALCDIVVVAIGGLFKLGYDPAAALLETTKEIRSRQGVLNTTTGKWEKYKDQDPSTLYSANYVPVK